MRNTSVDPQHAVTVPVKQSNFAFHRTETCWKCRKDFPRNEMSPVVLQGNIPGHKCPHCS